MPSPVAAGISHGTTQFVFQQLREVSYILIYYEGWQAARIFLKLLHQLQAAEGHFPVVRLWIDVEFGIGASSAILKEIRE